MVHAPCVQPEVDEPSRASGRHSRRLAGAKTRGMLVEGDAYETPPPKPFVSRHQRGFLEYDRRQVRREGGDRKGRNHCLKAW